MTLENNSCLSTAHYNFGVSFFRSHFYVVFSKQPPPPCLFFGTYYDVGGWQLQEGVVCVSMPMFDRSRASRNKWRRQDGGGRRHKALAYIPWVGGGFALCEIKLGALLDCSFVLAFGEGEGTLCSLQDDLPGWELVVAWKWALMRLCVCVHMHFEWLVYGI